MGLGMLGALAGLGEGMATSGKWLMEKNREEERDNRMAQRQQELEAKRQEWQEKELGRRLEHETTQRKLDRDQRQQQIENEKENQDRAYVLNLARHTLDQEKLKSDAEYRNSVLDNENRRIEILDRQATLAEKNGNLTDFQKEQLRGIREQMTAVSKSMLSEMATPATIARGREMMNVLQKQLHAAAGIKAGIADDPRKPDGETSEDSTSPPSRPKAGRSSDSDASSPRPSLGPDKSRPPSMGETLGLKVSQPDAEPEPEPQINNRDQLRALEEAGTKAMKALSLKEKDFDAAIRLAQEVRNSPAYKYLNKVVRTNIAELAGGRRRK